MHELRIGKNDAGQRLDKFLTKSLHLPTGLLYKSLRIKKIKVNRKRAEPNTVLLEGDTVQCFLADEFFPQGKVAPVPRPRSTGKIEIIYEDENILLVNKRQGLSVHEDETRDTDTLIARVHNYLIEKGEYRPEEEQSFAPALCNRIDRNTAGIVIAAKTAEALRVMNEKIKDRQIEKYYLCAVHGVPNKKEATVCGYLLKDEKKKEVRIYDKDPPKGAKEIRTAYKVLRTNGALSLLEVHLLTGRTHQIRAHLSHIGYPLLGDGKYGVNKDDKAKGYKYQCLCSYRLRFVFKGESTCLDYLNGKEFSIPPENIYFCKELFSF